MHVLQIFLRDRDLQTCTGEAHCVNTGAEVGTTELRHLDTPASVGKLQPDHSIHIAIGIALFRTYDHSRTVSRRKSENRLRQPPLLEGVHSEISEMTETIYKNSLRLKFSYSFGYFPADGFTLDLCR